jgi:hypothetical protein
MNIRNPLIIFLFFSIFSCSTDNQKRNTDVERLNLNGKVKSYLKRVSRTSNSKTDSVLKETHRELLLFNRNGNIIEKQSFKKNGEKYKKWISVYDKNQFEIETIEIKYANDTLKRWLNKYDNSGNEIESFIYDHKDSILSHTKSEYNKSNKETELIILKNKPAKNQLVKVSYDYDGNEIKTTRYYADKSKTEWFTEYDSNGNETEWRVYDKKGRLERKDEYSYTYDKDSNIIEDKSYSSNDELGSYGISKYDKRNNETEYYEYLNDSTFNKEIYTYNNRNDRVKTTYYNTQDILTRESTSEYKYDDFDNLIKEMSWKNGKLKEVRNYEIVYWQ